MKTIISSMAAMLICVSANASNLVTNGDFEAGNTGFTSDYTHNYSDCTSEGTYSVRTSAYYVHTSWSNTPDHTTDGSNYFIANGSPDTTDIVWRSSNAITVTQSNTAYRFEAYITSVYSVNNDGPKLRFQVGNGTTWYNMGTSATFPNGYTPGSWQLSYYDGIFEETGTYYIRLMNDQTANHGNDFGIDDIYFGLSADAPSVSEGYAVPNVETLPTVPEPATFTLIALGGLAMLKRRKPT